ncbi:MAG: hypothetical protein WAN33_07635 [Candidatus Acidiferrales bacterium]
MSAWKWFLLSFFGGGIAFWIFDVIIPAIDPNEQGYAVTLLCPLTLVLFYAATLRLRKDDRSGPSTAVFAICGMWILALGFTLLASRFRGGGDMGVIGWKRLADILLSSFIPTRVFELVTVEGSIIALLIGTVAMFICHFKFESSRWVIPPIVWTVFHHSKK